MAPNNKKCCVKNCLSTGQTQHRFPNPKFDLERMQLWLDAIGNEELNSLNPDAIYRNKRVCFAHFEARHKSDGNRRLHTNAVPTIGIPGFEEGPGNQPEEREPVFVEQPIAGPSNSVSEGSEVLRNASPSATPKVIQEGAVREFVKGFDPSIFNNNAIDNSKKSSVSDDNNLSIISSKPVETNKNDLENKSDKIVEVRPAPILFVSSSVDYKEEVLKTSNKQPHMDCDPLNQRIVQNPRYTGQCKDLESSIQTERNWNLAMNEISTLRKQVNLLQNRNRRLDSRVKSMKTLLRHFKKTHGR